MFQIQGAIVWLDDWINDVEISSITRVICVGCSPVSAVLNLLSSYRRHSTGVRVERRGGDPVFVEMDAGAARLYARTLHKALTEGGAVPEPIAREDFGVLH